METDLNPVISRENPELTFIFRHSSQSKAAGMKILINLLIPPVIDTLRSVWRLQTMKKACTNVRLGFIAFLLLLGSVSAYGEQPVLGRIGIILEEDATEYPLITKVFPDTPAAGAKLKEGQHITKVNGISTAGKTMTEWYAMIMGPEMTAVELEILGVDGKKFQRLICRKKITIP